VHQLIITMSRTSTKSKALPAQPDAEQISHLVSSVVLKARKNDSLRCATRPTTVAGPDCKCMLSSLTPRLVRSEVENKLGIPCGTLDAPEYKSIVKSAIRDAMVYVRYHLSYCHTRPYCAMIASRNTNRPREQALIARRRRVFLNKKSAQVRVRRRQSQ
jgi:hypothetical protein